MDDSDIMRIKAEEYNLCDRIVPVRINSMKPRLDGVSKSDKQFAGRYKRVTHCHVTDSMRRQSRDLLNDSVLIPSIE